MEEGEEGEVGELCRCLRKTPRMMNCSASGGCSQQSRHDWWNSSSLEVDQLLQSDSGANLKTSISFLQQLVLQPSIIKLQNRFYLLTLEPKKQHKKYILGRYLPWI